MKKTFLIIITCTLTLYGNAQQKDSAIASNIRTATDLKSGNLQDVFSSFFQLSASDLTGPNKAFSFKSTIMALRAKSDPSIMVDTNYRIHTFDRNFQFNFSLKLNQDDNFNNFSGGFTWAICNKRDSTMLRLDGKWDKLYGQYFYGIVKNMNDYRRTLLKPHTQLYKSQTDSINFIRLKNYIARQNAAGQKYEMDSLKLLSNGNIAIDTVINQYSRVVDAYNTALKQARTKPLLTLSANGMVNNGGSYSGSNATLSYLQGTSQKGNNFELDFRAGTTLQDTASDSGSHYHGVFIATGGFDWAFLSDSKTNDPILEIKPYLEYDNVYLNPLTGEQHTKLLADAELRIRITDNFWLPITVKYDTKTHNLLGFLDVSVNLAALKSPSK